MMQGFICNSLSFRCLSIKAITTNKNLQHSRWPNFIMWREKSGPETSHHAHWQDIRVCQRQLDQTVGHLDLYSKHFTLDAKFWCGLTLICGTILEASWKVSGNPLLNYNPRHHKQPLPHPNLTDLPFLEWKYQHQCYNNLHAWKRWR